MKGVNRLDYQPLFGKMSPHSWTQETAEIDPKGLNAFIINNQGLISFTVIVYHRD